LSAVADDDGDDGVVEEEVAVEDSDIRDWLTKLPDVAAAVVHFALPTTD